ncbi:Gfo/Idh/MocA family oxidoreductase [Rhizobium laguerreae]|uniref:Gfo/Idh/MocA family protein n=1 Tax=Rhizobium laguerreae TaxID=1076926 RepID=UPI001C90DC35|nr:Gfo/Idh/MocA family oxidoreductase [Rhizobium laguerreae]MBY3307569.1 Gfo/Idh/MocA family oxidoreductase [Rhizobium laguerreae]
MSKTTVGVGIIGLSSEESWAARAHVPAIRAADGYKIVALSTSNIESASKAASRYDVPAYFDNADELARHKDVDLVVVAVRVPHHRELVSAALNAGKQVYCEWPLGNGRADAEAINSLYAEVQGFVGLQGRSSPALRYIRDLVGAGHIGEIVSTTLVGSAGAWGDKIEPRLVYGLDYQNGVSMLTVQFGHLIDGLCWCLGEFSELSATLATRFPLVPRTDTGELVEKTIADQIAVSGLLTNGAVASVHYRSGSSSAGNFFWEINGTKGDLVVTASHGRLQYSDLKIQHGPGNGGKLVDMVVPSAYRLVQGCAPTDGFYTLAHAYTLMRKDILNGTSHVPRFADAVLRHRLLDAVESASSTGSRQSYS